MKSRAAILTLGEPIHKWENGAVKTLRNPVTDDDVQPPSSLPIFVNCKFPREHEIFLGGKKVVGKMLPRVVGF